jgi:hypothetical protein
LQEFSHTQGHRRLKVQKSSNINGKIFHYSLYYDNGISEVPVKDSNNNAIVKELKQELEIIGL